jgi:hypothetical protein
VLLLFQRKLRDLLKVPKELELKMPEFFLNLFQQEQLYPFLLKNRV